MRNPLGPFPRRQHFQSWNDNFNLTVAYNYVNSSTEGKYSEDQEDALNFGIITLIHVEHNYIVGGTSPSGCGILLDSEANYVIVNNNTMIHTEQCGIGVATGVGHIITGNKVLNVNTSIEGSGNTAIYVWNQYSGDCGTINVTWNIAYQNKPDGYVSSFWNAGNCAPLNENDNIWGIDSLDYLTPQETKLPAPKIPPMPYECLALSSWSNNDNFVSCFEADPGTTTGTEESSAVGMDFSVALIIVFCISLINL